MTGITQSFPLKGGSLYSGGGLGFTAYRLTFLIAFGY
jgi:hypothetical protein